MNNIDEYKLRNELEKKIFKYNDSDLIDIIIKNQKLTDESDSMSSREFEDNIKKINHNQIADLILDNFNSDKINAELNKIKPMTIKPVIKKNFPYENPREMQLETISRIYDAIEKGYKYIILEAVSGFGKSVIAATLSNIYSKDKSYILTTTNQLGNQFVHDFEDFKISKLNPRSSFSCKKTTHSCSAYRCMYSNCYHYKASNFSKDFGKPMSCEYLYNLKENLKDTSAVCTYDYFIQETFYHSNYLKPRKLVICDEGHNIDNKITDNISKDISNKIVKN